MIDFEKSHNQRLYNVLLLLWSCFWPNKRWDLRAKMVLAFLLLFLGKALTVMIPVSYKWATDSIIGTESVADKDQIVTTAIMFVALYGAIRIVSVILNQIRDTIFAKVGQNAVRVLLDQTFRHMHGLSLRFHLQRHTGGLSRIISRGATGIELFVRMVLQIGVPTLIECCMTLLLLGYQYHWHYVAIVTLTVIAYVWFTVIASNWRIRIRGDLNKADTDSMGKVVDSLINYETVKYCNSEELEFERYSNHTASYESAAIRVHTSLAWLNIGQGVILASGTMLIMLFSAFEVIHNTLTIGSFVMLNAFMIQLSMPFHVIGTVYRETTQAFADMLAVFQLLSEVPEVIDKPGAKPLALTKGEIRFDKVSFFYEKERPILQEVTFVVPPGSTIAIVGASGSGKSTIARLLFRFYDVSGGSISIDGQDIRDITLSSLRHTMGVVPQDTVLFNETIAYNIRYGKPSATDAEVHDVATKAAVSEFIDSLPNGYQTTVGERGLKVSGGEKQRLAIARMLLMSPPIIILDEATSALDTNTEKQVQQAFSQLSQSATPDGAQKPTMLIIAHRLATVVNADQIIVLKDGRIVEQGTHEELVALGDRYASMWHHQKAAEVARAHLEVIESEVI